MISKKPLNQKNHIPAEPLAIKLLGSFRLLVCDQTVSKLSLKARAFLAYLGTEQRHVSREKLADLLWPDGDTHNARQSLRQVLTTIRKATGNASIFVEDVVEASIALQSATVDAIEMERRSGDSLDALASRASHYQGRFLEDFPSVSPDFDEWAAVERARLDEAAIHLLHRLAGLQAAAQDHEQAVATVQRLLAVNPLREDSYRLSMELYAQMGRRAEALLQYEVCARLLKAELDVAPDAETTALANRLRSAPVPVSGVEGLHPDSGPEPREVRLGDDPKSWRRDTDNRTNGQAGAGRFLPPQAERKQITILRCELSNALEISTRLGPEDFRHVMEAFGTRVLEIAGKFGGTIAQYLDNGFVIYFGYPNSHEDDAERAVRAGLEAVQALLNKTIDAAVASSVRAGVATGLVVVSDPQNKGQGPSAAGDTTFLAARIQAEAKPGDVMISDSTRKKLGRFFRLEEVTERDTPPKTGKIYKVLSDSSIESRFHALRLEKLTPFVGRRDEIWLLKRRWKSAAAGEGHAVLLSGEAGIGKSRIIHRLIEELKSVPHTRLRYYCSPLHTQSALYPFSSQIERASHIVRSDSNEQKLQKIERLWQMAPKASNQDFQLITDLLGIEESGPKFDRATIHRKRWIIIKILSDFLTALAKEKPVLAVLEDTHWIDPTSLELVERLISTIGNHPILLLMTARPEFQPGWLGSPSLTTILLSRLARRDGENVIAGITSGKPLPRMAASQILARAEGVPLFIEELTKSVIESGQLIEGSDSFACEEAMAPLILPDSLQSSLAARIDILKSAKTIAQIGAVIGVTFSHTLLEAVTGLDHRQLTERLSELVAANLIYSRGQLPDTVYVFTHALVQDAAYATLLSRDRQQLHAAVARVLVEKFPTLVDTQPEVVAHHFTEANLTDDALSWWLKAGKRAGGQSALREAIAHLKTGLRILESCPPGPHRSRREYEFLLAIWLPLISVLGPDAKEASEVHQSVMKLMPADEPFYRRLHVSNVLFVTRYNLGQYKRCEEEAKRLLLAAQQACDPVGLCIAHVQFSVASNLQGQFDRALAHINQALPHYEETKDSTSYVRRFGWDPGVVARCHQAISLYCLGFIDDARSTAACAISIAESSDHPNMICHAYGYAGLFPAFLAYDFENLKSFSSRCSRTAETYNLVEWIGWSECLRAAAIAQSDQPCEAINIFSNGIRVIEEARNRRYGNLTKTAGAIVHFRCGEVLKALDIIDTALQDSDDTGEHWVDAELWRLKGDLFLDAKLYDAGAAETAYRKGLAIAGEQNALTIGLRCALSLGALQRQLGRDDEARALVQEHCARFSQGFETSELVAAREFLKEGA